MAKHSRKFLAAQEQIDSTKNYSLVAAVDLIKKVAFEKFDASVEIAIKLNVDPRQADQNIRGAMVLPHGTGKTKSVLVFAQGDKLKEAEAAGADILGDDDIVQKIMNGWFEFDSVVATPDMMGKIGKLGRVLGPRGLMPNPKTGTVTMDVEKAIKDIKSGKVEYRVDKAGNIHGVVGRVSFKPEQLVENIKALYEVISKTRPAAVKGHFVETLSLSSTMGPGVKVDFEGILG
jgi:large subunit ribosomal protein L1